MSERRANEARRRAIAGQAAAWVLRSDRGLSAAEQDEFSSWLAADPRHGAELARHRAHWTRLDRLARWQPEHSEQPNPDLLAPPLRSRLRRWAFVGAAGLGLAACAVLAFRTIVRESPPPASAPPAVAPPVTATVTATAPGPRRLEDGTVVDLNRDAELLVQFSPGERRVRLVRGEAHFNVKRNPARPFIVEAAGIDVRAVGTAFNVRIAAAEVEVLVTEGHVQVGPAEATAAALVPAAAGERPAAAETARPPAIPLLGARQRAVISLRPQAEPPQIATLTAGEIERVLAWQDKLLDFTATPLADVVAEFNRRNVTQLVVPDAALGAVRISARFRSENIEGFVHLLEVGFSATAERRGDSEIVLRRR